MKKLLLLALLALPLASKAQLVQSAEYPWRVQICDLAYNTSGSLTACPVTVFYQSSVLNGSVFVSNVQSVPQTLTVDLVAKAASTVVYEGTTYTYGQAFAIIDAGGLGVGGNGYFGGYVNLGGPLIAKSYISLPNNQPLYWNDSGGTARRTGLWSGSNIFYGDIDIRS